MAFFTYIMTNGRNGTLYVGSTDDLGLRVWQHKEGVGSGFTTEHGLTLLVWYEAHETREAAFRRDAGSRNGTGRGSCG